MELPMSRRAPVARNNRLRPRGLMVADAVAGLALLAVLATAIVIAVRSQHMASERLSDSRGATWAAELALAEMQAGKPAGENVRVEALDADAPPPDGFTWVHVRTERNGRSADLIGLMPKTSVPAQGGRP
jgi:type II secretory pathway pseudopilin PulG